MWTITATVVCQRDGTLMPRERLDNHQIPRRSDSGRGPSWLRGSRRTRDTSGSFRRVRIFRAAPPHVGQAVLLCQVPDLRGGHVLHLPPQSLRGHRVGGTAHRIGDAGGMDELGNPPPLPEYAWRRGGGRITALLRIVGRFPVSFIILCAKNPFLAHAYGRAGRQRPYACRKPPAPQSCGVRYRPMARRTSSTERSLPVRSSWFASSPILAFSCTAAPLRQRRKGTAPARRPVSGPHRWQRCGGGRIQTPSGFASARPAAAGYGQDSDTCSCPW